ncbi:MAG: transglutaminase-like domain-containing protein [Candidatus Beckwithbacteria bacterium]
MLKRKINLIIFFFSFLLFFKTPILAQTDFLTDYNVDYTVRSNGQTHAQLKISLINQLSNIYAKEFTFSIGSTELSDIKVYNNQGSIEPTVIQGNKTTNITVPFNDKVLGKDKAQEFTLEFNSTDFCHRLGSVWEISIPRLSKTDNLRNYQLSLTIPAAFGFPATITPKPLNTSTADGLVTYRFRSEDLFEKGIAATFGQIQYFDFNLVYHLQNPNVFPIKTEIALPPDSPFQTLVYQTLYPKPINIIQDADGNWLAQYQLSSKQNLEVTATGSAEILLRPKSDFIPEIINSAVDYLISQKYWETSNPRLIKLAETLPSAQAIYQYVVNNLIYDYGRLTDTSTRFGAANALDNPTSAVCMEFTDLFITLARIKQIPARAVNGFAYTTNSSLRPLSLKKDVLHAWPEYYDQTKNLWIPIDPTWGNTTGGVDFFNQNDLNHFAFVFQGQDSQYPIPAGAYKTNNLQLKDVVIEFGKPQNHQPQTSLKFDLPKKGLAGIAIKGKLILLNSGNIALYHQTITLTANFLGLVQTSWEIPVLPPFSQFEIPLEIPATGWNQRFSETLTAESDYAIATHSLSVDPAYRLIISHPKFKLYISLIGLLLFLPVLKLIYERFHSSKSSK